MYTNISYVWFTGREAAEKVSHIRIYGSVDQALLLQQQQHPTMTIVALVS